MEEFLDYIIPIIISAIVGMGTYIMRTFSDRLKEVEEKAETAVTEAQVRQILNDKIDPLKLDIHEINENIRKLFELHIRK